MTSNLSFWQNILNRLRRDVPCVLYVVAAAEKGSPGNAGFAMGVALNGSNEETWGTIGGGIMEKNLVGEASAALRNQQSLHWLRKLHHYKRSDGSVQESGLICSGSQTVVACTLSGNDVATVERILTALSTPSPLRVQVSRKGLSTSPANSSPPRFLLENAANEHWCYSETIGAPDTVIIAGGGHVGLALSRQMALLGFYVVVADEREMLETMQQNTFANERYTTSYQDFGEIVVQYAGRKVFVVIATAKYSSDVETLVSLAQIPETPHYIGLMGSKAKITTIMRDVRLAGVREAWIQAVRAPIGVQINSDTPEEIAVSIAAEIIGINNAR